METFASHQSEISATYAASEVITSKDGENNRHEQIPTEIQHRAQNNKIDKNNSKLAASTLCYGDSLTSDRTHTNCENVPQCLRICTHTVHTVTH